MADFAAVLTKTIEGLGVRNTAEMRQKVYDKARKTIEDKLAAISPPPSPAQAERQHRLLDDAIAQVEAVFAPPAPETRAVLPPVVAAPPAAIAPVSTPAPRPDRDPLEDFLASVDQPAPISTPAPVVKSAADAFRPAAQPVKPAAQPELPASGAERTADPVLGLDGHEPLSIPDAIAAKPKRSGGAGAGLVYGLLGLLVIGGAGYAGYLYKDKILALTGSSSTGAQTPAPAQPEKSAEAAPAQPEKPADAAAAQQQQKFTQRLTSDGQEVDAGPGAQPQDVGEGSTVAAATTPSGAAPATPAAGAEQPIAVGQKAIFYEEKTGTESGTADQGAVVWSQVSDSPGVDQPPEPAIRGELTIPGKNIQMRITIKRNGDKSLPASHIIEMAFTTPADFAGGSIEAVQRMAMKDTEQAPGSPLVGVPAAFGDGFFLLALTDEKSAIETNLTLLQRQSWIDIPVAYKSGRRALFSLEKGLTGDKVFKDVFKAWEAKGAAASGG